MKKNVFAVFTNVMVHAILVVSFEEIYVQAPSMTPTEAVQFT